MNLSSNYNRIFYNSLHSRYMNKGLHPIDIAAKVQLPPSMASHPYLQEHYAHLPWIIRNIYTEYFGWFSGTDLLELSPMLPQTRSERLVALIGKEKMAAAATDAVDNEDLWWGIELSTHVLRAEEDVSMRDVREKTLVSLAEKQLSSHARMSYLTFARREWNFTDTTEEYCKLMLSKPFPGLLTILKV